MKMGTQTWGPAFWYVLHLIADASPDEDEMKEPIRQ